MYVEVDALAIFKDLQVEASTGKQRLCNLQVEGATVGCWQKLFRRRFGCSWERLQV